MSALLAPAAALLLGLGAWRLQARLPGGPPLAAALPLWGALGMGLWMGCLDLAGLPWSAPLLLAPALIGLALTFGSRGVWERPAVAARPWALAAIVAVVAQVTVLLFRPAFGWDFRYIWGLKARVFCGAAGHDMTWLAWPGNSFAHPDYPPLWCDLLAAACRLGGDVAAASAAWSALLAAGLAAACWYAAAGAPAPRRALAAAVGGWAPVVFSPGNSGYAEPLLAFAAAVALAALTRAKNDGALAATVAAVAVAGLTKNEGLALACGVVLGGAFSLPRRRAAWLAAGLLPALVWRVALLAHGVAGEGFLLDPAALVGRLEQLPGALAGAATPTLLLIAACWLLASAALVGRERRGVRVALAVWGGAVLLVYLAGTEDMSWRMATSLDRVLAAPLPVALALALGRGGAEDAREPATRRPSLDDDARRAAAGRARRRWRSTSGGSGPRRGRTPTAG